MAALDTPIARGLVDADAGTLKPVASVCDRLAAKYRAMAKAK